MTTNHRCATVGEPYDIGKHELKKKWAAHWT